MITQNTRIYKQYAKEELDTMLEHFEPDGSHIPVVMTLFAEFQKPKPTSLEGSVLRDHNTHDVSFTQTLHYSGQRPGDGLLVNWRAILVGALTRWLGRQEQHGIDACDPSGA